MHFNETDNKNGIIQAIEFWTGRGDGAISSDDTLLKIFTARVNDALDRIKALWHGDDTNYTDAPIAWFNMVAGQNDYKVTEDGDANEIINIEAVRIFTSATAVDYSDIPLINEDHPRALDCLSPNTDSTGVPSVVLKKGNALFFDVLPSYNATNGIKIYFERVDDYFSSDDTDTTPGIPRPSQALLALYPSYDDLIKEKPDNLVLITRIEAQIARRESELRDWMRERNPSKPRMTPKPISFI